MKLTREEYLEYLKSPHWADVRRRYFSSKLPKVCKVCKSPKVDLHHRTYRRLGNERLNDLVPLCREHHHGLHEDHKSHGGNRSGHKSAWHTGRKYISKERSRLYKEGVL